jgi:DNA-binding NarL/FixJ family response regulator
VRAQRTPTRRQRQVLVRMVAGMSFPQIAHQLGLARKTVDNYAGDIYTRIGVNNAVSASIYCLEKVLTDSERESWLGSARMQRFATTAPRLQVRYTNVLDCLVERPTLSAGEIGKRLSLTEKTVESYIADLTVRCFPRSINARFNRNRRVLLATHWWAVWVW